VTINKNLKLTAQCVKTAGTTTAKLNHIRKNFHYRDRYFFLRLCKQYVRPHLDFAVPAWSSWLKGDIETLEKVQEKAVKMVAGLQSRDYEDRCRELGLDTLEKRREKQETGLIKCTNS
jgi:ribonuclease P/MRP protein subunit RPP40